LLADTTNSRNARLRLRYGFPTLAEGYAAKGFESLISVNPDDIFAQVVRELVEALKKAFPQGDPNFSGLVLLYAAMDIISSLSRPINQADTTRAVFKQWIDTYMLRDSGLNCSSEDIYAARCGILHTLSLSSLSSRIGNAKEIGYLNKENGVERMQQWCDSKGHNVIVVWMNGYLRAFYTAITRFVDAIQTDSDLRSRVFQHVGSVAGMISFNFR
jgi:hypothetical protein